MPGMNGIEATRVIADRMPGIAVLILSIHSSPLILRRAIEAGARGYLAKDAPIEDLEDFYRRAKQKFDAEEDFQGESRSTVVRLQGGSADELASWKKIVDETRRDYQPVYARLNVQLTQADERGESFYNRFLADVVKELKEKSINLINVLT